MHLEDAEVEVGGVAAGFVASRAGVQGVQLVGLGGGAVHNPGVNEALTNEVIHCGVEIKAVLAHDSLVGGLVRADSAVTGLLPSLARCLNYELHPIRGKAPNPDYNSEGAEPVGFSY